MPTKAMILFSGKVALSIFSQRTGFSCIFHYAPAQVFQAICAMWFFLLPAWRHGPRFQSCGIQEKKMVPEWHINKFPGLLPPKRFELQPSRTPAAGGHVCLGSLSSSTTAVLRNLEAQTLERFWKSILFNRSTKLILPISSGLIICALASRSVFPFLNPPWAALQDNTLPSSKLNWLSPYGHDQNSHHCSAVGKNVKSLIALNGCKSRVV